jgi:catechol 2,3-dioxygenase-like lactoylglutathione lyase family enzyme
MRKLAAAAIATLFLFLTNAQVVAPNGEGVSMGHLHMNAKDPEIQKKFWIEVIGATPAKLGGLDVIRIPGAIIFINKAEPSGGTEGTTINHVGVKVRDMQAVLAKVEAANIKILTRNDKQAMLLSPDDIRFELTADPTLDVPVAMHHIHFYTADLEATRKWYVEMFGAIPGKRAQFEAADLPGVNLSFSKAATAPAGTKGRAVDHIGFEVKNLEAFTKKLEQRGVKFTIPYRTVPKLGIAIAFFTDPWGTYVELTEGLGRVE